MDDEQEKAKKRVEQPSGVPRSFRFSEEDIQILDWLRRRWGASSIGVIRQVLREVARQEGMPDLDEDKGN